MGISVGKVAVVLGRSTRVHGDALWLKSKREGETYGCGWHRGVDEDVGDKTRAAKRGDSSTVGARTIVTRSSMRDSLRATG